MRRGEMLDKAKEIVLGQRAEDYGNLKTNFRTIADLWSIYLDDAVSEVDVANMMVLLKIARIKNGNPTDDSFLDIAGYAACGAELNSFLKADAKLDEAIKDGLAKLMANLNQGRENGQIDDIESEG